MERAQGTLNGTQFLQGLIPESLESPVGGDGRLEVVEENPSYSIGDLSRRSGLSVRTIRFYSDVGIVPASARSASGYRLYDLEAVARLDLVRTLRDLGFRSSRFGRF